MTGEWLRYKGYDGLNTIPGVCEGMIAIQVDGEKDYPELHQQMVDQIGLEQTKELFVCVEWIHDNLSTAWRHKNNLPTPKNGYYFKSRFEPYSGLKKAKA